MNKNAKMYAAASLFSAIISFFLAGSAAAAYEVKINLNTVGGGTGKITFSATSSSDFKFSGWLGESHQFFSEWDDESDRSCKEKGEGHCILKNLFPNSSKIVIAAFNAPTCSEFTYSNFGACQLNGSVYRTVTSANPPGCAGGNPITSQGCLYDLCNRNRPQDFVGAVDGAIKSAWDRLIDLSKSLLTPKEGAIEITKTLNPSLQPSPYQPLPSTGLNNLIDTAVNTASRVINFILTPVNLPPREANAPIPQPTTQPTPTLPTIPNINLPTRPTPNPLPVNGNPSTGAPGFNANLNPDILPPEQQGRVQPLPLAPNQSDFQFDQNFRNDPGTFCK